MLQRPKMGKEKDEIRLTGTKRYAIISNCAGARKGALADAERTGTRGQGGGRQAGPPGAGRRRVYLAKDADPQLIRPLKLLAEERGVEVVQAGSMKALGRACGIAVATACAAVVSSADGAEREQKSKAR